MAANRNESTGRTLIVALLLCLVCSVVVSTSSVALRPLQQINQELDRKTNILNVANMYEPGVDVEAAFGEITPRVVNLETGEYSEEHDPETFDGFESRRDPAASRTLSGGSDPAGLSRVENFATIYLVGDPDAPEQIILPIRGQGLWGLMLGFLAVEGDGNTIAGITYYEHAETPGLGGEVNNPRWQAQWEGKQIFASEDDVVPAIRVAKGSGSGDHEVDGLSGATLTANGVTNMLQFWLSPEGFGSYLAKFRSGIEQQDAVDADVELEAEGA